MKNQIISISDNTFNKYITQKEKFVLIDFWASWCGPCKILLPTLEDLSLIYDKKLIILKLNVDENPITTNHYNIKSIPTLILFKNSQVLKTIVGSLSKVQIEKILNEFIILK